MQIQRLPPIYKERALNVDDVFTCLGPPLLKKTGLPLRANDRSLRWGTELQTLPSSKVVLLLIHKEGNGDITERG